MHESENLKSLIHCPETAGKKREGVRFLHEIQFPGEEVVEVNQLRIAFDDRVRPLLEWQTNVETESVLASRAFLGRAHDAVAAAGDDHVILRHHFAREFLGHGVLRFARWRPG